MVKDRGALVEVIGAVAYGELQAYEGCRARAEQATTEAERESWRSEAAEERRHYEGFADRLRALGADPDGVIGLHRAPLDTFNSRYPESGLDHAVWSYLGEGMADDLLEWLRRVSDPETSRFVETVIADESGHEARAAAQLRAAVGDDPERRRVAAAAARRMLVQLLGSSGGSVAPLRAFVRLGRFHELIILVVGGMARRLRQAGISPLTGLVPGRF